MDLKKGLCDQKENFLLSTLHGYIKDHEISKTKPKIAS